jgi:acyl-CoA synthetase (AMP-forming)/AMP-acid ligase II
VKTEGDEQRPHVMRINLGDLVDRTAPADKIALIDCLDWEHPREYSHGEIDGLARACARGLLRRGLKRGDAIAILAGNRAEYVIGYFGAMRAGLVAVPVNVRFPRETIEFVLRDSAVKLVFCDSVRRPLVPDDLPVVDFDANDGFAALLDPGDFATVKPERDETAMVLYTSGSTGRPKGVLLSHGGQLWTVNLRAGQPGLSRQRFIVAAPFFHMNGLGTVKVALAAHATVVVLPQFDARRYIEAIGRFRVTRLTSVPTMLAMVVRERETLARTDLSSVEFVNTGSAPLTQKLVDDVKATFPRAAFLQVYGTTEAGPVVFGPHPDGRPMPAIALGWTRPGVEVRIVAPDGCDADEGVLWMRTPANMRGYLNLPEKTREVLTPDGWYISGDVMRRDADGIHYFVGRADDMFVCGGENVFPGEVEAMLETHPDIVQASVVPVPDEVKGEKPFAFVVARAGHSLNEDAVKEYALAKAPAYQHPRRVVFLDALPTAGTAKIDRAALRQRALQLWEAAAGAR